MDARIKAVAKRCKNRGGDCPCVLGCKAIGEIKERRMELIAARRKINDEILALANEANRLQSPWATLRDGFVFDLRGYVPVMVFDGHEASFVYEDENGEVAFDGPWPFNEDIAWPDDCERYGIRVDQV